MRTIHKHRVYPGIITSFACTEGATLLTVQEQGQDLQLWVELDQSKPKKLITVGLYGTGWDLPEDCIMVYLCTVQQDGLVWHVYEHTQ